MGGRRPGGLLWRRSFRRLWFGETISQLGNAMAPATRRCWSLFLVRVIGLSPGSVGLLTAVARRPEARRAVAPPLPRPGRDPPERQSVSGYD